ncbi:MAG: outer membrane protein assembly factor BamA [Flavobacteriaceae bacterium TMED238]|nr:MAG: outer membrane protein assembly factor BamA [Flavobacteriaceae bacterium TMED238]
MKFIKLFILFLLLSFSPASAEVFSKIEINGNKRVSDETIIIYGEIQKKGNYTDQDLNKILNNLYSTELFENISAKIVNNILKINLEEYKSINNLKILGEPSKRIVTQIKKIIKLKEKRSYIKSYLANDIDTIKNLYSSLGYNSSKAEVKIKEDKSNKIDLIIEINKGKKTKISSIKFIGDKKVKDKRLRDIIASEENKFWKVLSKNSNFNQNLLNLDLRLLKNYYRSIGYYKVKINSQSAILNKDGDADLVYSIDAGTRYRITKIETNADPVFDSKVFFPLNNDYKKVIGEYYSPFTIKKLLERLDTLIEDNNLQFVEHNVQEKVNNNGIAIKFNIFEGDKVLVERINIIGNNVTNENVIRSEFLIDEGDPFTNLGLDKSVAKIKARNLFSNVSSEVLDGSEKNLKIININVDEKPTGEISAGAGIGTDGGSFAFNISENNWLGEGKKVNFELEVDAESLSGTFNYLDPNYDFLGNSINYYLSSTSNDKPDQGYENTIFSAGLNTGFEQYKDLYATLGLNFSYDDLRTVGSASTALKKQSGEFSEISGSYGFKYDKRNRAFMPTDGSVISFKQNLPIYADRPFVGNTVQMSSYKEITDNIIGAGKFYFTSINGISDKDVRVSKRRFLSSSRLRGFKKNKVGPKDGKDHIGGNYAAAINLETNLPNFLPESTKTDFGLFLDFGNVWSVDYDSSLDDSNKLRASSGVALNWLSPIGPMSFVFSTDLQKADTDETEGFKFNLGTTF